MKTLRIDYRYGITPDKDEHAKKKIEAVLCVMRNDHEKKYVSPYASLYAPYDDQARDAINTLVAHKKSLDPVVLVVIGIGGSNLGALALHHALQGILYNESSTGVKVYWADSPDARYTAHIIAQAEAVLKQGKKILVTVISKSGTTTETIALFELFYTLLRTYHPRDYAQYCVAITDEGSRLWDFAHQEMIALLPIPSLVGGRYSVFSAAGLFPLAFLGIDIDGLVQGAQQAIDDFLENGVRSEAAHLALTSYEAYTQGLLIHDFFVFGHNLQSLGLWLRQLIAESLGKTIQEEGMIRRVGIIPTVSLGTQDLHSMVQLYLAGPRTTFTTFLYQEREQESLCLPDIPAFDALVPSLQKKSLASIESAIFRGVLDAYTQEHKPHMAVYMQEKSPHDLGYYMQLKMIEVMLLGTLLNVDPFDQPAVELYKKVTRKLLAHG